MFQPLILQLEVVTKPGVELATIHEVSVDLRAVEISLVSSILRELVLCAFAVEV
jgi:sporulation protein YlmC with PRC-barrel domain